MTDTTITKMGIQHLQLTDLKEIKGNRELDDVTELAESMKTLGLIHAILVGADGTIIAGARRYRAAKQNEWKTIPSKVVPNETPPEIIRELQMAENLQRDDLTPWEEAEQLARIEKARPGRTLEDLASHLGKSTTWVAQRRAINKLNEGLGTFLRDNHFPLESLPLFARVSPDSQAVLHKALKGERYRSDDPPSMSQIRRWLDNYSHLLLASPWDRADATLVKAAGSCNDCPKRSLAQAALFPEVEKNKDDRCLDATCWANKQTALIALSVKRIKEGGKKPLLIRNYGDVSKSVEKIAKAGCDIDYQHNYSISDKPKDGFKEAVVISGSETGRSIYVKKGSDYFSEKREKAKKPVDPTTGKPEEKTVKEKLKTLEQRRMCRAAELWSDALPELKVAHHITVGIASVFGTEKRESHRGYKWTTFWKMKESEREKYLWDQIVPVMQNRCHRFLTVENDSMPLWIEICSQADEMHQRQVLNRCWAQAVVELPMPKGLAKVVSDDPGRKMPKLVK